MTPPPKTIKRRAERYHVIAIAPDRHSVVSVCVSSVCENTRVSGRRLLQESVQLTVTRSGVQQCEGVGRCDEPEAARPMRQNCSRRTDLSEAYPMMRPAVRN